MRLATCGWRLAIPIHVKIEAVIQILNESEANR